MELKDIVTVTGMSGIFQMLGQRSGGMIVKSLETKETKFISTRLHGFTNIDTIAIYVNDEQDTIELMNVLTEMLKQENTNPPVDYKSSSEKDLRNYFKSIVPNYDEQKVHLSDIKKVVRWFHILKAENLIKPNEEVKENIEEIEEKATPKKTKKEKATKEV